MGKWLAVRLLLDTHAFLWWLAGSPRLSGSAQGVIGDDRNTAFVSAASAWEIATKSRLGKLPQADAVAFDVRGCIVGQGFEELAIDVDDAERAGRLPGPHRDPFDRVLIAQAQSRSLPIVSTDRVFDRYGVQRIW